jgi:hypothetical protein
VAVQRLGLGANKLARHTSPESTSCMWITLSVTVFWCSIVYGGKYIYREWRRRISLQPARGINEIVSVEYYRRLSNAQFESLVLRALKERGYTLLGDPWLGRANEPGYAWHKGKKTMVCYRLTRPLSHEQLVEVAKKVRLAQADNVLVFSPLMPDTSYSPPNGVKILAGNKLVRWFAVLDMVPPVTANPETETCECGAKMNERVSRAGKPLLVCSMYPDCRVMREPDAPPPPTLRLEPGDGVHVA